jgi:hypothetical protein
VSQCFHHSSRALLNRWAKRSRSSIRPNGFRQRAEHVKKHAVGTTKRASRIKVHSLHVQFKGLASKLRCSILTTASKVSLLAGLTLWSGSSNRFPQNGQSLISKVHCFWKTRTFKGFNAFDKSPPCRHVAPCGPVCLGASARWLLAWMMVDANVAYLSPSSVYRILDRHQSLCRWKPSRAVGQKPEPPSRPLRSGIPI